MVELLDKTPEQKEWELREMLELNLRLAGVPRTPRWNLGSEECPFPIYEPQHRYPGRPLHMYPLSDHAVRRAIFEHNGIALG